MSRQGARQEGRSTHHQAKSSKARRMNSHMEQHNIKETHTGFMAKDNEVTYVANCLKDASREELIETILYTIHKADKRKAELKTLHVDLEESKQDAIMLSSKVESLQSDCTKTNRQLDVLQSTLRTKCDENACLLKELNESKQEAQSLRTEVESLKSLNEFLSNDNEDLRMVLGDTRVDNASLTKELAESKKVIEALNESKDEPSVCLNITVSDFDHQDYVALKSEHEKNLDDIKIMKSVYVKYIESNYTLQKQCDSLQVSLNAKIVEYDCLLKELNNVKAKFVECLEESTPSVDKSEFDALKSNYEKVLANNETLKTSNEVLTTKLANNTCIHTQRPNVPCSMIVTANRTYHGYVKRKHNVSRTNHVGLHSRVVCFHCGCIGHKRFECNLLFHDQTRHHMHAKTNPKGISQENTSHKKSHTNFYFKSAPVNAFGETKQIWVRKDSINTYLPYVNKGSKQVWIPTTNP